MIDFDDIQGLLFSGYSNIMKQASYHLLQIDDVPAAKAWLQQLIADKKITHGDHRGTKWCLNIAFSASGLEKLVGDIETFELAFREGMHADRRSRVLGDVEGSAPEKWKWGNQAKPIDILLMIFSQNTDIQQERDGAEEKLYLKSGLHRISDEIIRAAPAAEEKFGREHFGFTDGIAQPVVPELKAGTPETPQTIKAGEFLLGQVNEYHETTLVPTHGNEKIGLNGSYLVFRQLQQDVAGFWNFMEGQAKKTGRDKNWLAAKAVGRWPSGAIVKEGQDTDPKSITLGEFSFDKTDPHGNGCPIGSHIRRSNPRDRELGKSVEKSLEVARRHRILRRGRNYGSRLDAPNADDGQERGLLFLCLNANIERQFEFVQHSWANNVKFGRQYNEKDPIIGAFEEENDNKFSIPGTPVRTRMEDFQRFVHTRGGGYFFLPGLKALRHISA